MRHLFFLAVLAHGYPAASHVGDRLLAIPYLSEETLANIELDGYVDDWAEALCPPTLTALDFHVQKTPPMHERVLYDEYDPANLDFRIWMGWSPAGRLFVAGEFADNIYRNELLPPPMWSLADGVALMVDGDHSGGERLNIIGMPEPDEELHAQYYGAVSSVPSGPKVKLPILGNIPEWMSELPFSTSSGRVAGENPTFWTVEFFVTCFDGLNVEDLETSVVSDLAAGDVIGLNFFVFDWDESETRKASFYLADKALSGRPDHLMDAVLLGPGQTAVEAATWGRIKATVPFPEP